MLKIKIFIWLCFCFTLIFLPGCFNKQNPDYKHPVKQNAPDIQKQDKALTFRNLFKWNERSIDESPLKNPYTERLHDFIKSGHLLQVTSPNDAKHVLGKPLSRKIKKIKNKHEKNMDEWLIHTYEGIVLVFYHAVNHDRYFLFNIEITGTKHPVMYNLTIGKTKEDVLNELGKSGRFEEEDTLLEYSDPDEDYLPGLVRFYFTGTYISKIVWIYPLD